MSSLLRPVHTNVLSYNPCISIRLGILSKRWAFSSKTHRFENVRKWTETKTHTYRNGVDGRKRIKMKKITENVIEFNLRHNAQFYLSGTFWCGQSKTHQNGNVNANWLMRFWWQGKCILLKRHWCGQGLFIMPIIYPLLPISPGYYSRPKRN